MKTVVAIMMLWIGVAHAKENLYEIRWDGTLCTLSGGTDRRILRNNPVDESCRFPVATQKNCVIAAFSNAKTLRYDGDRIILTPQSPKEAALGDLLCEPIR